MTGASLSNSPGASPRPWPLVMAGATIGLTWAAGLRGWMIQMAGDASSLHWYGTFALLLVPGLLVGALIGLAEHRRRTGGTRSRLLILPPCLFLAALTDPVIFRALITNGFGGGAIGVVLFGLAGGYALSGRGRAWRRRSCGAFAVLGVLLMLVMASDTVPFGTPQGTWVGLYAASLLAVLCVASSIPQWIGRATLVPAPWIAMAVGALCGLAWASTLRAFMWEVAGDEATVDWAGTFLWVLLPGAAIGALLAWTEHRRWTGQVPPGRWVVWTPMLFGTVLLKDPLDLGEVFQSGIGLAAVSVPAICMIGGYAIAGQGARWVRVLCGLLLGSAIPIWVLTATGVGGPSMSLDKPHGAWAAVLYWGLLTTFSMAAAIPHRGPMPPSKRRGRPPALSSESARATTS